MTLIDKLISSLRSIMCANGGVAPAAILWTDADGQWLSLMETLRSALPSLYMLGKYDRDARIGPAIWLKCIVDRTLPEAPPVGETPVFYLPRVSRQDLRAAGECPPALQPLVELQYRGKVWHQSNGQDWTVRAFLVSDDALGLDVAGDRRTEEAFLRVLPSLATIDTSLLKGRRLDATDFDKLAIQDPVRDLLSWLDNPDLFETRSKGSRWESFRALCKGEFGLDPEHELPSEVAGRIILADQKLDLVWRRFTDSPNLYAGVAKLLREPSGMNQGNLVLDASRDPRGNDSAETELRKALEAVVDLPHANACTQVVELEAQHAHRRNWVWARIGMSPWANALQPLARLASAAQKPISGITLAASSADYAANGWKCDSAAMAALASATNGQITELLSKVVKTLYEQWLDSSARNFQSLIEKEPDQARKAAVHPPAEKDTCILFVDGLRFDLAGSLAALLESRSFRVAVSHRLAPLPTVTATAKPVASPVEDSIRGETGENFSPLIKTKSGWKLLTKSLLEERLEASEVDVIDSSKLPIPSDSKGGGWSEFGKIDSWGHSMQADLVTLLDAEVKRIADQVASFLDAGWNRVRVVTDHGWLLLPGGLPKVELPPYLVETKWARCALVKGQPDLKVPVFSWHWNTEVQIATPPGIGSFRAGEQYAHGGVSPQECVVPELLIERGLGAIKATIKSVEWRGMRCRVSVWSSDPEVCIDLRTEWRQSSSSVLASTKNVGTTGEVSFVVDDDYENTEAYVVLIAPGGNVVANQSTRIGGKA